jgi:nucleoid-associated protein YgaU
MQTTELTARRGAAERPSPINPEQVPSPPEAAPVGDTATAGRTSDVQPPEPMRQYTVRRGDSLSKIAQRHYGSRRRDVVQRLFEANRGTLSSPDSIRAGQTLVLPPLHRGEPSPASPQASSPSSAAKPVATATQSQSPRSSASGSWRWYQVRKGDKYEKIARRELGDAARWKELHELNKHIFPDPARIRWGVRIKIPVDSPKARGARGSRE